MAVQQAIRDIESGTVRYYVRAATGVVPIRVVDGRYLRSQADSSSANNLDSLPLR